jgi:type IV pilus assembly protein PilA
MKKGFTLIELLIVVAIIGILAAVGAVTYNGITTSAKVSVAKANHMNVVSYVSTVIIQCQGDINEKFGIGHNNKEKCSKIYTKDATQIFVGWTQNNGMTNPYNGYGCCGHASNRDPYLGETYIAAYGTNTIVIKTNAKKGDSIMISTLTLQ